MRVSLVVVFPQVNEERLVLSKGYAFTIRRFGFGSMHVGVLMLPGVTGVNMGLYSDAAGSRLVSFSY